MKEQKWDSCRKKRQEHVLETSKGCFWVTEKKQQQNEYIYTCFRNHLLPDENSIQQNTKILLIVNRNIHNNFRVHLFLIEVYYESH